MLLASARAGLLGGLGTLAAGLALNWLFVLWTFRLAASAEVSLLLRTTGQGVIVLLFGILAPLAYLVLAKQVGGQSAARRLYGHHRDDIVRWVANTARESAAAADAKAAAAGPQEKTPDATERMIHSFSQKLASAPRPVASVTRLLLRRSPLAALLPSLATLSAADRSTGGSVPAALVAQIDTLVSATLVTGRRTFVRVIVVNAVVIVILAALIALR